jgi:hypothetical protein
MRRSPLALAGLACLAVSLTPASAAAASPPLTVSTAKLKAALHCHGSLAGTKTQPIMLVTGTGASGEEAYAIGKGAFDAYGHPVCDVDFPNHTTADIQVSVQYLVYGIREEARRSGRRVAVIGISQGGLLPRVALTYWPDLRTKVTDVIAAAGTQHGTTAGSGCTRARPCTPAGWQQRAGSKFLRALNAQPDETPGPTAWTTLRSATDEVVRPQSGAHPTSALAGATNISIQSVCPGRKVTHIGTALDSVTFAAFEDALAHDGPAKVARLPKDVCDRPYADGLDPAATSQLITAAASLTSGRQGSEPRPTAEPAVRALFKRRVR